MAVNFKFRGLMVPAFTCFNNDRHRSVNYEEIPKYIKFLKAQQLRGVLLNGTSGEGTLMTLCERKKIIEVWVKTAEELYPELHIMLQVGGAPLPDILEMAAHAERIGTHSLLVLPDLFVKPANTRELIHYVEVISKAAPRLPLLYYHIPLLTGVNIHMGKFLNDIGDKVPTFVGIKFTSNLIDEGVEALNACDRKFVIFLGADTMILAALAMGFDSMICTTLNLQPELIKNVVSNFDHGNLKAARQAQDKLSEFVAKVTKLGAWVPAMKSLMPCMSNITTGPVRKPYSNVQPSPQLEEIVKSYNSGKKYAPLKSGGDDTSMTSRK